MKTGTAEVDARAVEKACKLVMEVFDANNIDRITGLTAMAIILRMEYEKDGLCIIPLKPSEAAALVDKPTADKVH